MLKLLASALSFGFWRRLLASQYKTKLWPDFEIAHHCGDATSPPAPPAGHQ
ncbi:hypothetical protein [Streptomyces sp. NPDC058193]|uniref:hypothetical protein n=1 Tax=Streptomyces sp. NPDC058193 TaxID=3346373 RepID=UPI0036E12C43